MFLPRKLRKSRRFFNGRLNFAYAFRTITPRGGWRGYMLWFFAIDGYSGSQKDQHSETKRRSQKTGGRKKNALPPYPSRRNKGNKVVRIFRMMSKNNSDGIPESDRYHISHASIYIVPVFSTLLKPNITSVCTRWSCNCRALVVPSLKEGTAYAFRINKV